MDLSPDEDNFQGRLLHQAALWDNVELLSELLQNGADINSRDAFGRTCVHAAAVSERSQCLRVLCERGAELDVRSDERQGGKTALHIAAERGHTDNVRTLMRAGADVTAPDGDGVAALAHAQANGHRHAASLIREFIDAQERERHSQHSTLRSHLTQGDVEGLRRRLEALGAVAPLVVNLTPGGANTLLYTASESGLTSAVSLLLDHGADGRAHPVTKYSPLYAAAYHGHTEVAKLLLRHFPEAVRLETVERWLPLHAACIGGHATTVSLLLEYKYPEEMLETYTDPTGKWRYKSAFNINAVDARGQSSVYMAATLGNIQVLNALLSYSVECEPVVREEDLPPVPAEVEERVQKLLSPTRGISLGIHAIVSKLTGGGKQPPSLPPPGRVQPAAADPPRAADPPLAGAARGGHARCVAALLAAGANPDMPAQMLEPDSRDSRRKSRSTSCPPRAGQTREPSIDRDVQWTALAIAVRNKNSQIAEMLLQHGATDVDSIALKYAVMHGMDALIAPLLATKAVKDGEYRVNRALISQLVFCERGLSLSHAARCPNNAVIVNWRGRDALHTIKVSWLRQAALRLNPQVSPAAVLHAITRIDVSNNELTALPGEVFTMISLRYLNVAQNKLERLPLTSDVEEEDIRKRRRGTKRVQQIYTAPVLQEIYLQNNRLEDLPPDLFSLPSMSTLDVSNNKLRKLPKQMWSSTSLRDLNVALNHLKDLPAPARLPPSSPATPAPPAPPTPPAALSCDVTGQDSPVTVGDRKGNAVVSAPRRVVSWRGAVSERGGSPSAPGGSAGNVLSCLNLAHNQFPCVPPQLACAAPKLTRLNMAYNSLRSMSYVTSYPTNLRQLDLSHNEITCWPSLPQLDTFSSPEPPLACYCAGAPLAAPARRPRGSLRDSLLAAACPARRHLRLQALRTLILSNNMLTRIQLTTDDDGYLENEACSDEQDEWSEDGTGLRSRLVFPQLSMLDVSCNLLKSVPPLIHQLSNLCVLNVSGNKDITDLPPQMGLLTRLWNLNTSGCSLSEPLKSLVNSRCRSADVVGYLRSVLHEATVYTTMKLMCVGQQGIGKTTLLDCLRHESGIQHRRKQPDHWAKRMGNKASLKNMSTVGVDIGTWSYDKQRSTRGAVTFRTWDFGGQQEYYATHQYFLSKRSLYLVVWKVTDGRKGLAGALTWLRSIQARAPGSPVIMVATHYDQVPNSNLPESESPECLQRIIRTSIIGAADADKLGLPKVMDSLEVSCSTKHNIRLLADIIYSVAFSVKPPGSKEPLLEQKIPASYLHLEECVTHLANELKDPVVTHDEYKRSVTQYMQQKNYRMFRDAAELHQATMFLHDNGVLLHYDDANLKQLYFLRPQWLCDVLAHVVTVREINPFASNGIMKASDLSHVFKASPSLAAAGAGEAGARAASLLSKFELALWGGARQLLLPSLLPSSEPSVPQLPLKSHQYPASSVGTPRRSWPNNLTQLPTEGGSGTDSPTLIDDSPTPLLVTPAGGSPFRRVLLMSYVPCGLWPRLCTRLITAAPKNLNVYNTDEIDDSISKSIEFNWSWKLWKTGIKLVAGDIELLSIVEIPPVKDALLPLPHDEDDQGDHIRYRVKLEGCWSEIEADTAARISIVVPATSVKLTRSDGRPIAGYQSITLEPNPETLAKILALVSDQLDMLLEDWYPSLGTRFVHTSEGRSLITRLVPCPACLRDAENKQGSGPHDYVQNVSELSLSVGSRRGTAESRSSDADSGVGHDSNASSRLGSVEGAPPVQRPAVTAWSIEQCTAAAAAEPRLPCGTHGGCALEALAPDLMLLDLEESKRTRWDLVRPRAIAGRGAFGTVLTGEWMGPGATKGRGLKVAIKALQPVPPPPGCSASALHAYKAGLSRWERCPEAAACRAYLALRQELCVLQTLRHPHTLPLLAATPAPFALLLPAAPQGALDRVLRDYAGAGVLVPPRAARALALQIARALEYLHSNRVLYRDLKSENVLVWEMASPAESAAAEYGHKPVSVHVKLGDYGISRLAPPSGTKGFGGTEGFMAPEIMRYNGEEEYNEKVDCFSFGMLLYEIVTLRQPFEGHEAVKEAVLEGARPALSPREVQSPCCLLDLMRRCWSNAPESRPSAAGIVAITSAPEFTSLMDAASCRRSVAFTAVPLLNVPEQDSFGWEVWYGGGEPEVTHTLTLTPAAHTHHHTLRIPPDAGGSPAVVSAMCRAGSTVWIGDSRGRVTVYNASTCGIEWSWDISGTLGGGSAAVSALEHLPSLDRVALALHCGRLFLVSTSQPEDESSFILTELGTATELNCLAAVPTSDGWEVWAGGDSLSVYSVGGGGVNGAESVVTAGVTGGTAGGAGGTAGVTALTRAGGGVAASVQAGVCVYLYSSRTRQLCARLDCSKLVPCSESLQSISIEEQLTEQHCTVTSLCTLGLSVYIGTAGGCIIVADAITLRPLTIFRPHESEVVGMVGLMPPPGSEGGPMLATFGTGYRPLLDRYAPQNSSTNNTAHSGSFCLLWRAHHWLPD